MPASLGNSRLSERIFNSLPMVALDRPVFRVASDGRGEVYIDSKDAVVVENTRGAEAAVRHLVEVHGHRRVLFLGERRTLYTMQTRYAGYLAAMRANRLSPQAHFECDSVETAAGLLCTALSTANPPTAIFSANSSTTRFVLQALVRLGVPAPGVVALVSFDDLELGDLVEPALTVVAQPVAELGERAAHLLFARLAAGPVLAKMPAQTVLPVELIVRHSCGCVYPAAGSD